MQFSDWVWDMQQREPQERIAFSAPRVSLQFFDRNIYVFFFVMEIEFTLQGDYITSTSPVTWDDWCFHILIFDFT